MRRQTTKQPRGPAVRATPMPATMARTKKKSNMPLSLLMILSGMAVMLMAATAFAVVVMIAGMRMRVVMMMAVIGVAMIGHRAIRMLHPAIGQMSVIVMVAVNGKALGRSATEQT